MITKKLLSEILGAKVNYVIIIKDDETHNEKRVLFQFDNIHYGGVSGIDDEEINIYELAHKCKQWAYKLDEWTLSSSYYGIVEVFGRYSCTDSDPDKTVIADTEPEAVFKACQWIMENRDET